MPTKDEHKAHKTHLPCSVGYFVKCSYDDTLSFYKSYFGSDCIEWFVRELKQFAEDVDTVFQCPLSMEKLSEERKKSLAMSTICHICKNPFREGDKKHLDHSHLTSKARGVAHPECNMNYKDERIIPVVFHNFSSYDSHFLIREIATKMKGRIHLIASNKERFISFTKRVEDNFINFRFIDSLRFLNSSLSKLVANLTDFLIIQTFFDSPEGRMGDDDAYEADRMGEDKMMDDNKLKLITRKGVYPYDYFDSFEKFKETHLPLKEEFYNQLEEADISDEDYQHAQRVWETFECEDLEDFWRLYLKTDVLLPAEVLEQFWISCQKAYGLDVAHHFTLPGYTWSCMLKHTKIELELLTDIDQVMFIERGIRGGIMQCQKRYAKANNEYLRDYDPDKEKSFLMYLDFNSMYSDAMEKYLPTGGFEWLTDQEIEQLDPRSFSDRSEIGYILEVDLDYPEKLHDEDRDLPFCSQHVKIAGEEKLMTTLHDKEKYILHYLTLKQALENGFILKKVHRALKFKQSPWLKSYVDLNNEFRRQATTSFERDLFKLMNNAVFGKAMENVRKRVNAKILTEWDGRYGLAARIASPHFHSLHILDEEVALVEMKKTEVYIDKPIYVGMAILGISKLKLYNFHYNYMKSKLNSNASICYMDTDSFIYYITGTNIYDMIKADCYEQFDTSNYDPENIHGIPQLNRKVSGMMKDENAGKIMKRFIGLRAKMYATDVEGGDGNEITKKVKGIKKSVVEKRTAFEHFAACLQNFTGIIIDESLTINSKDIDFDIEQNLIRSKDHRVSSIRMKKLALSPLDNKRYLMNKSFDTLPWGHHSVMNDGSNDK